MILNVINGIIFIGITNVGEGLALEKEALMEKEATKHTIFDDVFRTMVQKMPQLLLPVIKKFFRRIIQRMTTLVSLEMNRKKNWVRLLQILLFRLI